MLKFSFQPHSRIIVRLIGGLGNQMFQYAAARALAKRRSASLDLDISGFASYGQRRFELDTYPIAASIASTEEFKGTRDPASKARSALGRIFAVLRLQLLNYYREPHFHYDAALARQRLPLYMDGYWQSERYFADAAAEIRAELTPHAPLDPENAAIAAEIDHVNAVSLHVRRGDYVSSAHTNAYHGSCSLEYYRSAIAMIRNRCERPHLFVFSDDHEWPRDNLKPDLPTTYVTANNAECGFRDVQLISRCRHHIIANSSFSWWGAWLNPRPDKIVVAPERWFSTSQNDTRDLIPQQWFRI